jgi:hypothetical protein
LQFHYRAPAEQSKIKTLIECREPKTQGPDMSKIDLLLIGVSIIALAVLLKISVDFCKRKVYERVVEAGMRERNAIKNEDKVKKAIYTPRAFRRTPKLPEYDPTKHFRKDGRTDRKW